MNKVDLHIPMSHITFVTKGDQPDGKCIFENQKCLYSCVNYDFTYGDPGDEVGYRLFRLSHADSGKVLGHYIKSFSK